MRIFKTTKNNFSIWFLLFSLVSFPSLTTWGDPGGWISSGGEVFKHKKNPWFLKNTKQVSYCVQFSENEFSIDATATLNLVQSSIQYWKEQLNGKSSLSLDLPSGGLRNETAEIATQDFQFNTTCKGTEDLIFKFGFNTLNTDEITHMKVPEKFIGLTILKEYDEINLKGTGIIYVTGDRGLHAYKKTSKDVIDEAWKYPKLLQYVLIHELGHVFGLPHSGSGLMSEVFLDQLLIRKFAALYVREPISTFIKPPETAEICHADMLPTGSQDFLAPYFSLTFKEDCLKLQLAENKKSFLILTKKLKDLDWKQIGILHIDKNELVDFSLKPAIVVQLTETQKIFPALDSSFLIGPIFQNYKVDGHITFGSSIKPYTVQVDLSPDSIVVYGLHENRIRQIFRFGNPLLYSLSKPF